MNARLFVWSFRFGRVAACVALIASLAGDEEQEARDFPGLCILCERVA